MNTSERMAELAAQKKISLKKLAELSDVPYSTLKTAKLRGSQLSVDTIESICTGLDITLSEFFSDAPTTGHTKSYYGTTDTNEAVS